jgi:hypothetical protein
MLYRPVEAAAKSGHWKRVGDQSPLMISFRFAAASSGVNKPSSTKLFSSFRRCFVEGLLVNGRTLGGGVDDVVVAPYLMLRGF